MRRAFIKNALDDIDSYIERDTRQELPEIEYIYKIEGYEDIGNFNTIEEATEYALNHTSLANEEFISDFLYKEAKDE